MVSPCANLPPNELKCDTRGAIRTGVAARAPLHTTAWSTTAFRLNRRCCRCAFDAWKQTRLSRPDTP